MVDDFFNFKVEYSPCQFKGDSELLQFCQYNNLYLWAIIKDPYLFDLIQE